MCVSLVCVCVRARARVCVCVCARARAGEPKPGDNDFAYLMPPSLDYDANLKWDDGNERVMHFTETKCLHFIRTSAVGDTPTDGFLGKSNASFLFIYDKFLTNSWNFLR